MMATLTTIDSASSPAISNMSRERRHAPYPPPSSVNGGSRVQAARLPAAGGMADTRAMSTDDGGGRGAGTLLVIDDTPENLRVVVSLLEAYSFTVLTARDGEAGIERA